MASDGNPPPEKGPRKDTDFLLCLICQQETCDELIGNPSKHSKVLSFIRQRATYGDGNFPELSRRVGDATEETLRSHGATWHRRCYQDTCHPTMCKRAKERYEKRLSQRNQSQTLPNPPPSPVSFTRSQSNPYDSSLCFFCEEKSTRCRPLFTIRTDKAGWRLHSAIEKSNNDKYRVRLNTAINPHDAHAIDIQYHNICWTKYVTNVLRKDTPDVSKCNAVDEIAADIEFTSLVEEALLDGEILSMSDLHSAYVNIRVANCVEKPECARKKVKDLISCEIPGIEFHKPKQRNKSELVSLKDTRDKAVQMVSDSQNRNVSADMKTLFDAAIVLRGAITKAERWSFNGALNDVTNDHVPKELYTFFRWVLQGTKSDLSTGLSKGKSATVDKHAKILAESTISHHLSDRQSEHKSNEVRSRHEMPTELGLGIAVRQATKGKRIINLLHGFGVSVAYERLQKLETQIAKTVLNTMQENNGVYIPAEAVLSRHIFFAMDNIDFDEDTPNGKRTTHGTVLAIYQRRSPEDTIPTLKLTEEAPTRTLKELPSTIMELLPCRMQKNVKPKSPAYPTFVLDEPQSGNGYRSEMAWLLGQALSNKGTPTEQGQSEEVHGENTCPEASNHIPKWSAYNSLIGTTKPLTYINTPPLIAAPAHEWSTLLTVLKQAQGISAKVVGEQRKTVISLDLGLYKPAKELQMARDDCNHMILRPGELHTVMASLRTIGSYMDGSGLDLCWIEANIYGSSTVKQILEGRHVNRGVTAHLTTLQALFILYAEAFYKDKPDLLHKCTEKTDKLNKAFRENDGDAIKRGHSDLEFELESLGVLDQMSKFDDDVANKPLAKAIKQYMQMVVDMITYIKAVRTADWILHLQTTEVLVKYFFAHDKLNYARLIPLYLADMKGLDKSDPEIWAEFMDGNWVVNKSNNPFCAIGADHGLEQEIRRIKGFGGITGITLSPITRTKFFLVAPDLARLAREAEIIVGMQREKPMQQHHDNTDAKRNRQVNNVTALKQAIANFTNPFTDEYDKIINIVTKAVMPDKIQHDISHRTQIGEKCLAQFVEDRIKTNNVNVWAPMKKVNLQMWSSSSMKTKTKCEDKIVELKEDRALFARMLVVSKARDIDLKDAVGTYEFSVVPRALFAADGSLLYTASKSDLMSILESLPNEEATPQEDTNPIDNQFGDKRVAVIDAMADLQKLDKPENIKTCRDLADHFIERHCQKYSDYNEVHLVFDRYDTGISLKASTRERRLGGKHAVAYHITDSTSIGKVSMQQLLAHVSTKDALTAYLAEKLLAHAETNGKSLVVAWQNLARATHREATDLSSSHEEADTKIILHSVDASANGATSLDIHSPDTDVLVLAIRRYPRFCPNTSFVTGVGQKHRVIPLEPIYTALGPKKAAALPGFHAISGADVTGKFAGKGKTTCWKVLQELDEHDDIVNALSMLGTTIEQPMALFPPIEAFVCQLYITNTDMSRVADARWWLFKKKQAQSEGLPPTQAALQPAILRAHYQAMIWNNDIIANPSLPEPQGFGWTLKDGNYTPVMTSLPPAPQAVLDLIKCSCSKTRCSTNHCKCRRNGLNCTDLCNCCEACESCDNSGDTVISDEEVENSDSEDELDH